MATVEAQTWLMLREMIDSLRFKCVPGGRELGLAYESSAIVARYRRVGAAWTPHLEASKAVILQAAARCAARGRALVIGAGACLDVPVQALAETFTEVILADAVVSPEARKWARRFPGRVSAVAWDATGFLDKLARHRNTKDAKTILSVLENAEPDGPPGGEADLVVSANCLSQLGLIPADELAVEGSLDDFSLRCAEVAAKKHISWLAARPGVRVLLSDLVRLDVTPDGREIARHAVFERLTLRAPDKTWRWSIAPIPEWSRDRHRVHEVGAWIDGGV